MEKPEFLRSEEVAYILDRTPRTVRNWANQGALKTRPRPAGGGEYQFYWDDVVEQSGLSEERVLQRLVAFRELKARQGAAPKNEPLALAGAQV